MEFLIGIWSLSIVRACAITGLSRRAWYRKDAAEEVDKRDAPVIEALNKLIEKHNRWGFWMCFHRLRNLGHRWNHKRVWRVYKAMKLNQKRRTKKRLPLRDPAPLGIPAEVNSSWSFDFMSDALYSGTRYRVLNIIDEGVREALDIVVDTSITAARVVRSLDQLKSQRGLPQAIRVDNGPEMTSNVFAEWCSENSIRIDYIEGIRKIQPQKVEASGTRGSVSNQLMLLGAPIRCNHIGPSADVVTFPRDFKKSSVQPSSDLPAARVIQLFGNR